MMTGITYENELFISSEISNGTYPNREAVINAGLDLLKQRNWLLEQIDVGRRQLDSGDCIEFDDEGMREYFAKLKAKIHDKHSSPKIQ